MTFGRKRSRRRIPTLERLEGRALLSLTPAGDEFRLNSTEVGHQWMPEVAMDADGDFVVTWTDTVTHHISDLRVHARLFDSSGRPKGPDFTVNSLPGMLGIKPTVAMDDDGDFVIAWQGGVGGDDSSYGLYARRYNAQGQPQGPEFRVSTPGTQVIIGNPRDIGLAMGDDGSFVAAWSERDAGQTTQQMDLRARRFDPAGAPVGDTFRVDTDLTGAHNKIGIGAGMDDDGGFLIAWRDISLTSQKPEIYARRYDGSGDAHGPEFLVNVKTESDLGHPSVGMAGDGRAVVTWKDWGDAGEPTGGLYGRRVDASGDLVGSQFQVASITNGSSLVGFPATAAMADDGTFAVTWLNWDLTQPKIPVPGAEDHEMPVLGIHFQQYTAGARKDGPKLMLNAGTGHDNGFPAIAMDDAAAHAVVVWSRDDTDNQLTDDDTFARLLTDDGAPTPDPDPDPDPNPDPDPDPNPDPDPIPDPNPDPGPDPGVNEAPTVGDIANVTVDQDAPNTVIPLFDVFADAEDADAALRIQLAGNTNASLFSSVSVDAATGLLTIDYAPGASGEAMLIVRATDTAGAYVDEAFDVTVRPGPAPQPDPDPVPTPDPNPVPDPAPDGPPTPAPVAQGTKSLAGRLLQKSGRRRVGVAGMQVFLDADDDGVYDAGEAAAVTGADGSYVLSGLAAGKYRVRLADNSGWRVASRRNPSGAATRPVVIRPRQQRVAKVKPLLLTPAGA